MDARLQTKRREVLLAGRGVVTKMGRPGWRWEMSPRIAYIEKLRRIASREKGMRRAFLHARAREAEAESDEQFCRRMRVRVVTISADGRFDGTGPVEVTNGRRLNDAIGSGPVGNRAKE